MHQAQLRQAQDMQIYISGHSAPLMPVGNMRPEQGHLACMQTPGLCMRALLLRGIVPCNLQVRCGMRPQTGHALTVQVPYSILSTATSGQMVTARNPSENRMERSSLGANSTYTAYGANATPAGQHQARQGPL